MWATRRWFPGSNGSGIPQTIAGPSLAVVAGLGGQLQVWLPFAPAGAIVVLLGRASSALVCREPLYRTLALRFMPAPGEKIAARAASSSG